LNLKYSETSENFNLDVYIKENLKENSSQNKNKNKKFIGI
jgi:hypothetical protein